MKKSEGVETKYQSNSPGAYWIKISDANKLRDKALKAERERIFDKISKLPSYKKYKGKSLDIIWIHEIEELKNKLKAERK